MIRLGAADSSVLGHDHRDHVVFKIPTANFLKRKCNITFDNIIHLLVLEIDHSNAHTVAYINLDFEF
ncbi:hypothetical protein BpHYR1_020907 [Brachionus plicatilis]|uniref:Uncharacterized protein n=1 Tax=Brachionus plicatilis TaxID=10195 RepID=A0A3M7RED9_BRAPC|nr:hypothetical protein BpHYR1_020907 [Brachionus plicatilis]